MSSQGSGSSPSPGPISLQSRAEGTVLRLRVKPKARADQVLGLHGGALKVSVRSAPEGGKANESVRLLLARVLGVPPGSIELLAGGTSQNKTILVRGMNGAELSRLIRSILASPGP